MTNPSVHVAMPGSFNFDVALPSKLDINVGARSHFFQPPSTPSASSSLHRSTLEFSAPNFHGSNSRKRSRHDSLISNKIIPLRAASHDSSGAQSPPPFTDTKYELAGGLDTPTRAAMSAMDFREEEHRSSPDVHFRGVRGFRGFELTLDDDVGPPSLALEREGNGRSRNPASRHARDGLGRVVYTVVDVAGKVLEFCKTTAFKGFYAGGGQGYQLQPAKLTTKNDESVWPDADGLDGCHTIKQETGLVPGRFPYGDYIPDYMSYDHTTPPRASKKIQREKGTGEISASWVLVDSTSSREASPSRLSHRKVPSAATSTRKALNKRSRGPILTAYRSPLTSHAGSPSLRSDQPASLASTRSLLSTSRCESSISAEVQRHAAKLRKRELQDDANLKRLNQQLKAMIKEGREALGSKFEVQDEPTEEDDSKGKCFFDMEKG